MTDGKGKTIIILHGWKLSGSTYDELASLLRQKGYRVLAPSLPGFGREKLKNSSMTLSDYVKFLDDFMFAKKIEKAILVGHSFGGRVAIKYAWMYPAKVEKLVLTGTPVIREISFKKRVAFITAKTGNILFGLFPKGVKSMFKKALYRGIGEYDYYKSGELRDVFLNVINEDLVQYAKDTRVPTILVWGQSDRLVPSRLVKRIQNLFPKCEAVIVSDNGHNLPYANPKEFVNALEKFI